jgi:alpha,alpha-trehalose phosphorylase
VTTATTATYLLRSGEPLEVLHHGNPLTLTHGQPITRQLVIEDPPPRPPPPPPGRAPFSRGRSASAGRELSPAVARG